MSYLVKESSFLGMNGYARLGFQVLLCSLFQGYAVQISLRSTFTLELIQMGCMATLAGGRVGSHTVSTVFSFSRILSKSLHCLFVTFSSFSIFAP